MVRKSESALKTDNDSGRIARRDRRRAQSREEILDAAERVLFRDGIGALTVDAVARELELTKAALYYYFPSKDALTFEMNFRHYSAEAQAIHDAVQATHSGDAALRAIIETTIRFYAHRMHIFRLVYLYGQVASVGFVNVQPEMFARIRPLNDLIYLRAEELLEEERAAGKRPAESSPRRVAFVAHMSAVGVLTMKGLVESVGDPLIHSDDDLIEELCRGLSTKG